jgi:hypothetical protein
MIEESRDAIHKIVKTVASPLRFFAVAAVALAAIVIALGWRSTLPAETTATLILVAFGSLVLLILLVAVLVVFAPKKLTFDQEAHLTVLRERLGDNELKGTYLPGALPAVEPKAVIEDQRRMER